MKAQSGVNYSRWRAISLSAVYLLMGIHIAHWKISGTTLAPLELNEVLYTIHLGIITAGFIFMGVTIVSTLVFGRFFCSWMCHILALQDASEWILTKLKIKPKHIRSRTLLWVPVIAVAYMFVLPQIERWYKGLPAVAFKMQTDAQGWSSFITHDFWRNLPGIGITVFTFFIVGFLIIYLLGSRSFCQYGCPYGVLFAAADRLAPGKIKLTGDCNQCGICTTVCSSHIQVHKEIHHFGKVVDHNCLKDLDCVQACPNDAIKFGFTKPSGWASLRWVKSVKKHYDFTLKEDLLLLSFFIIFIFMYSGLYDAIPFLLAVGLAVISSAMVLKFSRLIKDDFARINNFVLRQSGNYTTYGKGFLAFFGALMLFSVHSSFIRYHQWTGEHHYKVVNSLKDQGQADIRLKGALGAAEVHLLVTHNYGLYSSAALLRQLAAIAIYREDHQIAKNYLQQMIEKLPGDLEARLRLAKLLIVTKQAQDAFPHLRYIINENAWSNGEKKLKSDALMTLGHLEEQEGFASEALQHYRQALHEFESNFDAQLAAGVLLTRAGKWNEAREFLSEAAKHYTNSPLIENNLAVVCLNQKQHNEAKYHLEKLINMQPGNVQAVYNLSMVNYKLGFKDAAIVGLQNILVQHPDHKNAHEALMMIESREAGAKKSIGS